jgi:hypothetical protein
VKVKDLVSHRVQVAQKVLDVSQRGIVVVDGFGGVHGNDVAEARTERTQATQATRTETEETGHSGQLSSQLQRQTLVAAEATATSYSRCRSGSTRNRKAAAPKLLGVR